MSDSVAVCDIEPDLVEVLKQFREGAENCSQLYSYNYLVFASFDRREAPGFKIYYIKYFCVPGLFFTLKFPASLRFSKKKESHAIIMKVKLPSYTCVTCHVSHVTCHMSCTLSRNMSRVSLHSIEEKEISFECSLFLCSL